MTTGGAGSTSNSSAIQNPVAAAGPTSTIATSGRSARAAATARPSTPTSPTTSSPSVRSSARYAPGTPPGDLVIIADQDPRRPRAVANVMHTRHDPGLDPPVASAISPVQDL